MIADASVEKNLTFEKGIEKVELTLKPKELNEYILKTDEYNPDLFYLDIPLKSFLDTDDLIKGDVIDFSFYGYREDVFDELNYCIMSIAEEDSFGLKLSEEFNDYSITSNSAFVLNKKFKIINVSASEIDEYVLKFRSPFMSNETNENHRDSIKLLGNIKMELDKTNRIKPVTVTFDATEETIENITESVYPGRKIKTVPVLENKFYEWADSNGNIVRVAPDHDVVLHVEWSNRLDLISRALPFNWLETGKYQIKAEVITPYPDADVVMEIEAKEDANWDAWNVLLAIPYYGNDFPKTETEGNTTFYRKSVSEIIKTYKDFQYLAVAGFDEIDGLSIKALYLEYSATPENKTGLALEIKGPVIVNENGLIEVQVKENTDGSIVETRTTTYKDGVVKTSVITNKKDGSKKIIDIYSSGEKFEAEIAANGTSTVKAYKNGTEIELKNCEFWDNKGYEGQYNYDHHLKDFINSEDLVEGDVLHISYYGFAVNDFENITCVVASGSEEDNWYLALSEYYSLDPLDNIYKNTSFVFNQYIPITRTSRSDFRHFNLVNTSRYLSSESTSNHPETKNILAYVKMEIDKSNRISPVNITYNSNAEIDDVLIPETLYPGSKIKNKLFKNKNNEFFTGWFDGPDENANPVNVVPESNATLYAHWSENYYCANDFYLTGVNIENYLKPYRDGYLTYTIIGDPKNFHNDHLSDSLRLYPLDGSKYGNTLITDYFTGSYYTKTYSISINDLITIDEDYTYDYLGFQYVETEDGFVLDKNNMYISYTEPDSVYPFIIFKLNGAPYKTVWERNEIKLCEKGSPFKDISSGITPTWEGRIFGGWYFDDKCTDGPVADDYIINQTTTLYAKWIADSE